MCGRYVLPEEGEIERVWHIGRHNWRERTFPRFNVAPTTQVPIIRRADDGVLELDGARWGLIPTWWKKEVPPAITFNARSEEASQKPTWRQSMRSMRCLMPVRGWYEWNEHEQVTTESGRKTNRPYFIHCPSSEVIAFAALWSIWQAPNGAAVLSCALLTKEAAPSIAAIHHRMPVVLAPDQFEDWLGPATAFAEVSALIAAARGDFTGYPVSTKVNNARNDSPELVECIVA